MFEIQTSKLSSAFLFLVCAAVFALCFRDIWIIQYKKGKRVKTDFLQQRIQAVNTLLWQSSETAGKKTKKTTHTHLTSAWGNLWLEVILTDFTRLKTLIRNSPIPTVSPQYLWEFCPDNHKRQANLHQNNLSLHSALTTVVLVWIPQEKSNVQ